MHQIITGPAASGKTRTAMAQFQSSPAAVYVVPSATMAEHLRHELARSRMAVRPQAIRTFAQFLDGHAGAAAAPAALVSFLVEQALETLPSARFAPVKDLPGFHRAVAELLEEAPPAGLPGEWGRLLDRVQEGLRARGMALRNTRLQAAAAAKDRSDALPCEHVVLDGFFSFSAAEMEFLLALSRRIRLTLTLPEWPGAEAARQRFLASGFAETRLDRPLRAPGSTLFAAATLEREAEEIARRILDHAGRGRRFREIGIVLRSRDPYAALLETTLARFGIPARFYFSDPLAAHPVAAYFTGLMRALLAGWDHDLLLAAIRMPVSGIGATPAGDRLDFEWRERLPGKGLPQGTVEGAASLISTLAGFDVWRREKFVPHEWAERLKALRDLLPAPVISGAASREQVEAWRSTARALDAVEEALDAAAVALSGSGQVPLGSFWRQVETVLALEPLRIADRRRDVVHVMDVFEARQWELPVVLVCGLTERHFPQYHREDPLIGDAERRRLGLDTAADRQSQERFLFDLAITRASEEVILSYPRFDEKGEETLPSFFLDSVGEAKDAPARIRPKPHRNACVAPPAPVTDPLLLQGLAEAHFSLSPTSIESFLQCPFQFFAKRTLRLRTRPAAPRDRLDALLQGSILHRALAEWTLAPLLGEQILGRVFDEECARMRVPQTYRTEAVRLELLRNFLAFVADRRVNLPGWVTRVEQSFRYPLHGGLSISGRIDRLEESPARHAVVIDYKYSAANRIRDHVEETGAGARVQAGLYLAAVGRVFGLIPAGMLFCGLKKAVAWDGWHRNLAGLEGIGESCTESVLDGMIREAEETAARAYESITAGRIAVEPADRQKCEWCDYHDICRVETISTVRKAGGA